MKKFVLGVIATFLLLAQYQVVLAAYAAQPAAQASSITTLWQAREVVIKGLQNIVVGYWGSYLKSVPSQISINGKGIYFRATYYNWGTLPGSISLKCVNRSLKPDDTKLLLINKNASDCAGEYTVMNTLHWRTSEEAQSFADAMNYLRSDALGERNPSQEAAWRDFQQKAADWRVLAVKPPIPEEVRAHWVAASNFLREKNIDKAVSEFEKGIALYPVWSEGHFNAATLCAELFYYSEAIQHMKAYLELVPDALDARSARDQMSIWQSKL